MDDRVPSALPNFAGRAALVTGSSSGIGAACARQLSMAGARVVLNSASSPAAGHALAAELPGALYVRADVSRQDECARLIDETIAQLGRLDILVNNAGTTAVIDHSDLDTADDDIWQRIFQTNVMSTWHMSRMAMPHLRSTGRGAIVNVSSLAGVRPTGSSIPYAVSKAAVNHLTRLLANVAAPDVRVNAVAPGLTDTPWTQSWSDAREAVTRTAPLARMATAEDVAEVVVSLAGFSYVTGEVVLVDGGIALRRLRFVGIKLDDSAGDRPDERQP